MTTCLTHIVTPDLKSYPKCRLEYEEWLMRVYGPVAVINFRNELQKELVLEAIRS